DVGRVEITHRRNGLSVAGLAIDDLNAVIDVVLRRSEVRTVVIVDLLRRNRRGGLSGSVGRRGRNRNRICSHSYRCAFFLVLFVWFVVFVIVEGGQLVIELIHDSPLLLLRVLRRQVLRPACQAHRSFDVLNDCGGRRSV